MSQSVVSPYSIPNVRLFLLFRMLFNARFYYPVFSILFLDFGLTLSQFALLNVVWAVTIVLCEVPSGALADSLGRRRLLVLAGFLMVVEIALWAFVPLGNMTVVFWVFVVNRILSGMAEAAASGADEALAYDSLKQAGDEADWGLVLEKQIQLQSVGFIIALAIGGLLYDPEMLQRIADVFGLDWTITAATTLRLPIYCTLFTAILTLITVMRMREPDAERFRTIRIDRESVAEAFRLVWQAGRWIWQTPFVLALMLFGLICDSPVRMMITMVSQYYRLIEIPEYLFGVLGSLLAMFGFFIPGIARRLCERRSPLFNVLLTAATISLGLIGICFVWPWVGLVPALLLFSTFYSVGFFLSYYINQVTSSEQRATVLSFKGLFMNLGYGGIGLLYALLLYFLRQQARLAEPGIADSVLVNRVFVDSLPWFVAYFVVLMGLLLLSSARLLSRYQEPQADHQKP